MEAMKYITLLRGINVSGQKLIKMEYLRELYTSMGFSNVYTYIQSGNIIFDSHNTDHQYINNTIEINLQKTLGYKVESFIRNFEAWENVIQSNPFPGQTGDPDYKFYVTFLGKQPEESRVAQLISFCNENETYILKGLELFVLLRKNTNSKDVFSNNFVESKLKISATTRNWNTILKIMDYNIK